MDMLRDKLVMEINDDKIQRRLLAGEKKWFFQETFNITVDMESALKDLQDVQEKK